VISYPYLIVTTAASVLFWRYSRRTFFKVKAVSATSGGRRAILIGVFDFQHGVYHLFIIEIVHRYMKRKKKEKILHTSNQYTSDK